VTRIAGDSDSYEFRLCRMVGGVVAQPTKYGFKLRSSTTIIKNNLAIPAGALTYWGMRVGLQGMAEALDVDAGVIADMVEAGTVTAESLEELLKTRGVTPNMARDSAGDRGSKAHLVLECLAEGWNDPDGADSIFRTWAEALAMDEEFEANTRYGWAAIEWWDAQIQPFINSGEILDIASERPVWSLTDGYAGTLDLALLWKASPDVLGSGGWEILDAKTHKPASGFTKPGQGPGYDSDAAQIRSYRKAWEEMGLGKTIGQRTVVLRDRAYKGQSWLEDHRSVPYEFFKLLNEVNDHRIAFEKGSE
jgi:hypothetical protein